MREEGGAAEPNVPENDQVREVRAREEERPRVGEQEAPVEQWRLAPTSIPGGVDEHRGEKGHRRVEVQHSGDRADHDGRAQEQGAAVRGYPGELLAGGSEKTVVFGHQADEDESADQHER
jgi:hypothetical protein